MTEVRWIKIVTDIFDDEKILLIESLPSADSIIVIWFKLLCLAGKNNNSGVFMLNDRIPYTDEMLATIFRRDVNMVRLALKTFSEFGMVEILNNVITIPNWSKHQTLDQLEERKEYMREYMQKYRGKQKLLAEGKVNSKVNSKANVNPLEEEIEEEIDKDIEEEKISWKNLLIAYNDLPVKSIRAITDKRKSKVKARINSLGITYEDILQAFNNIRLSKFLLGNNNRGWIIDLDWLFENDNNFTKVLEGKYTDKESNNGCARTNTGKSEGKFSGFKPRESRVELTDDERKAAGEIL